MKLILLLAIVILSVASEKHNMLKSNKIPKGPWRRTTNSAVCEECKVIITRFGKALEDPRKINELKAVLRMLCHETSYVEECKLFVDRLDYFIAHIQPYLKNPEEACEHIKMCNNKKIETYHKISVAYFYKYKNSDYLKSDLLCEECQFAASELKNVVEEEKSQQKVKKFLSEEICSRLGKYQGSCDVMLDQFLPTLFEELDKMLSNSKQFCSDLGLCNKTLLDEDSEDSSYNQRSSKSDGSVLRSFIASKVLMKVVRINDTGLEAVMVEYFEDKMAPLLHDSTYDKNMSCVIKKCKNQKAQLICNYCKDLVTLITKSLKSPDFEVWLKDRIKREICAQLPDLYDNLCENAVVTYVPVLIKQSKRYLISHDICRQVHL